MATALAVIPKSIEDDDDVVDVAARKKEYLNFLSAKADEIEEQRVSRHYYHGDQWTSDEIRKLKERRQPLVTSNRIVRKIDAIVGLIERLRQDPKCYPRTPQQDEGAELGSAGIRFVLDNNDWKSKASRVARFAAVDGISGIEYELTQGDQGDPSLAIHLVYGENYFYDPRSFDEGFTDARYNGVAKWVDIELAKEMFPDKEEELEDLVNDGGEFTTSAEIDKERNWISTDLKRIRLVDHWYIKGGKWCWCIYVSSTVLMEGVSPFIDEKGLTFSKYRMFSASVDHDGDRYGFIRNLRSPQDEINHRRSKALHLLNSRRVISEKGAVDDVEKARKEWARPDGWVEINPGLKAEPDQTAIADFKGQLEMLQEAKNEIENFGPNPALIGQGLEDSSGRAISLLQQAGVAELGPYLTAYKNWKIRVYRDILNIIQRYWTSERWIRVTDDQNVAQFFKINKLSQNEHGQPIIVNAIGSIDVDIIIDEGPDAVNLQADAYMVLQSLGPSFAQEFPEIALELAPLPSSVKKPMLDKIKQKQNAPPRPDPKVAAQLQIAQSKAQIEAHGDAANAALEQQSDSRKDALEWRKAQLAALTQIEVARIGAKTDADSASLAARLEMILGFSNMAHEQQQSAQDRAHELDLAASQPEPQIVGP
jgi:hypothetical protein